MRRFIRTDLRTISEAYSYDLRLQIHPGAADVPGDANASHNGCRKTGWK